MMMKMEVEGGGGGGGVVNANVAVNVVVVIMLRHIPIGIHHQTIESSSIIMIISRFHRPIMVDPNLNNQLSTIPLTLDLRINVITNCHHPHCCWNDGLCG